MPHTNHARDRFLLPFVALLLVGSVSWAADSPVTVSVRPTVVFAGRDVRPTVAATQCFAVLGLDDSADTFRAPPRRSAALADASAGRSGC
jgi:hypothetical protein